MCSQPHRRRSYCVPPQQVTQVYNQTTITEWVFINGRLIVLDNTGRELYDLTLGSQGDGGGNGIGVPAAPSVADLDGDGNLEIVLLTFDHGVDVYTIPGSGTECLPWLTGRGNLLRNGQGPAYVR